MEGFHIGALKCIPLKLETKASISSKEKMITGNQNNITFLSETFGNN